MKKIISIISVFLLIIGISGCGANTNKKGACGAGDPQVVMVTDTGGINDKSFNQGTWEGIQQACSDLGVGGTYIQTTNESELEGNLRRAAQEGKIVVAVGFSFEMELNIFFIPICVSLVGSQFEESLPNFIWLFVPLKSNPLPLFEIDELSK